MPAQIFFYYLTGSKKGKIEASDAQVTRIGRQPYCELKLDPYQDIPASGDHCHVIREQDGYYLLDSGSTFGTFLNGTRVQGRVKLSTGDVIECGKDPEGNREGPRLKFYLEADIRKCPVCAGPIYKRHFRCPTCRKKTCLRCIDFPTKTCKRCAAGPGFEVVEDDSVKGKKPARVVVSGKEAKKVKRAQKAEKAAEAERAAKASSKPEEDSLSAPFCGICQNFVKGEAFVCPACGSEVCATHRQGKVCQPCAGVSPEPSGTKKTKQPKPIPPSEWEGVEAEPVDDMPSTHWGRRDKRTPRSNDPDLADSPTTRRFGPSPPPTHRAPRPQHRDPRGSSPPVQTGVATCARCHGPLGAGTFCCRACRRILCFAHVAVDDYCEDCYLARRDRVPGHDTQPIEAIPTISEIEALDMMPLLDTEKNEDGHFDDDLARPPPGAAIPEGMGFQGLSFVCPHCDAPLAAAARACPRCRKVL